MAGATQKYRLDKYGKEARTDQRGVKSEKGLIKNMFTHLSPALTSIREAVFGGKERREGEKKKEGSKLLYPRLSLPKTDPQNSKYPCPEGAPRPSSGAERRPAKGGLAWLLPPTGAGQEHGTACQRGLVLGPPGSQGYTRKL